MHTHSRLAIYAVNGQALCLNSSQHSAFGRRLLALSAGFHQETLNDEQLLFFLEELEQAAERQLERFQEIGYDDSCDEAQDRILCFLEGVLDLCDQVDQIEYEELESQVQQLETELTRAVLSLNERKAA